MRTRNDPHRRFSFPISRSNTCADRGTCSRHKANCSHGALMVLAVLCAFLPLFGACAARAAVAPIISAVPDQVANEDEPILDVPFTVWDPDTPVNQLRFSTFFSFNDRTSSRDNIVISGTGTNRWLSIYPLPDAAGLAQASITVSDGTGLSATARFQVQVNPVNDPPRLSAIPNQTALKGQFTFSVPFLISDPDNNVATIRLTAWSSRQSVVNNAGLRFGQGTTITNRTLLVTLSPTGSVGSTAITIQAADIQDTNTASFVLNVVPPEFGRSSNTIGADTSFQPIWGDFNGDGLLDLVVSTTSIQTNRGNGLFSQGIQLPATQASSAAAADYDGDGDLDLLFYGPTTIPRLFRNNGGASPTFSLVSTNWASLEAYRGQLLWTDMDGDGDLDILGGTNDIRWLRNEGQGTFTDTGTGIPSRTVLGVLAAGDFDNDGDPDVLAIATGFVTPFTPGPRLYLNDGTGRLTDSQISLPQGVTRAAGWADVDNDGSLDLWLLQGQSFTSSSNSLVVLRQVAGRFVESFRLNDAASSALQTTFVPPWADFDNDGNIDFVGRFWSRLSQFGDFTNYPSLYRNNGAGQFSTTGLSIAVDAGQLLLPVGDFDDDGSPDLLYRSGQSFLQPMRNQTRSVNALPGAPWSLHALVADNIVTFFWNDGDDANQSSGLTYNVRVGTAPGKNEVVPSMSTTNGTRMIPARGNAENNNWKTLDLPLERLNTETLYWTVQAVDNGFQGGPFAPEQTIFINPAGNTPPSIVGIGDLSFPEDTTTNLVFYVRDDRTPPNSLRVHATSSNTNLLPAAGVKLSGFTNTAQGLRVNLSLTPLADRVGDATITVTATDRGGLSTSRSFFVTVTPVNDPPVLTVAESLLALAGAATPPLQVGASDKESPIEELTLTAQSLTPLVVPNANISITRVQGGWQVVATPVTTEAVQVQIELALKDPQGAEVKRTVTVRFQRALLQSHATLQVSGSWPNQLIWADFNGDRRMDLLTSDVQDDSLTIHEVESGSLPVRSRVTSPANYAWAYDIGDFDNDGDVDLLLSALVDEGISVRTRTLIYRNLGGFQFERVAGATFDPGEARFSDFDLDGRLDVLVAENPASLVVYRNGTSGFEAGRRFSLSSSLPDNALLESLTAKDLDGDGRDELVLAIHYFDSRRQAVFRSIGERYVAITNDWASSPLYDTADFDQDQLPDLVTEFSASSSKGVWRNLGGLNFVVTGPGFVNSNSRVEVADFDGDGISDVLDHGSNLIRLLFGRRDFTFDPVSLAFGQANAPVAAPADFDGDGAMDLAVSMIASAPPGPAQIAIYRGQSRLPNSRPGSPANLRTSIPGSNAVMLSWNRALDANQSGGLTYNVRMGTAPGLSDVVSPLSLADGFRLVPRVGNAGWSTNRLLTGLRPGGAYYWSVQAVDNSFAGGPFSAEASFTMPETVLTLRSAGTGGLELELHAASTNSWEIETSKDLRTWQDHPTTGVMIRTGTNGVKRLKLEATAERQFFRARRID